MPPAPCVVKTRLTLSSIHLHLRNTCIHHRTCDGYCSTSKVMTGWEVILRCRSSSRTEILELPLTTAAYETSDLVYSKGALTLCPTREYSPGCGIVMGRISGFPIFIFETYERQTVIEFGPADDEHEYHHYTHSLPPSTVTAGRNHMHLRRGDTIAYNQHGLKVAIHVQQMPSDQSPNTESQTQTPRATSSMADTPHQEIALSVNTSHETIATQPLSQHLAEDSETDDDLDTPAPAAALSIPGTAVADRAAQVDDKAHESAFGPEPEFRDDESPLQQMQQAADDCAARSSEEGSAAAEDQMLSATTTSGSNSKTYGQASRHASHISIPHDTEPEAVRDGSQDSSKRGTKRKTVARPDVYEVDEDPPVKKRKGRLTKVARFDEEDNAASGLEEEIVVAPSRIRKRAPARAEPSVLADEARPAKALFSGFQPTMQLVAFLKQSGVTIAEDPPCRRTKFVCVVPSTPLKTTSKILRSLVASKPVVTQLWLSASKEAGNLLEIDAYIHKEVRDAIMTDRRALFRGKILFFTRGAKISYGDNGWGEIAEMARDMGATSVESGSATTGDEITPKERVVFVGIDIDDKDVVALIKDHGRIVYSKTMFTETIIKASFTPEICRIALSS
ncbi:hypothetical protein DOTSEDRAFT_49850 [Dothistroma septosporum NZE10]|uniref:BRCT domain-containing protein n=1 Tax=Dothistroma septosporum (strain NZE10 / CBS 128990) TaxID=675120 RepID=N1Q4C7_DOTSN|nr:hypothetical protein DOTSEDRAFT_49850 [Dothistroma septosporum NZE10]